MLSYNVAALLRAAPGTVLQFPISVPQIGLPDRLQLAIPLVGEVRLTRTGRSILARARIETALTERCSRCLTETIAPIVLELQEEALPSVDIDSGRPVDHSTEPDTLRLDAHHELDLSKSVQDAISLAEPIAPLCRPDCRGLCAVCGANLNSDPDHHHADEAVDPRLASLAELRNRLEPH